MWYDQTERGVDKGATPVPAYTGSADRLEYQREQDTSPDRFEPGFDVVLLGSEAWLRFDVATGYCEYRCGTLRRTASGIEVTLPVGYIHGRDVSPFPESRTAISRLTYWDEETHRPRTVTRTPDQLSVLMPDNIQEPQGTETLRRGEVAYIGAWEVRYTPDGRAFIHQDATVRREPLGKQFMRSEDALIIRSSDDKGLTVVLPKGYMPQTGNVSHWTPVDVQHADTAPVVPPVGSTLQV